MLAVDSRNMFLVRHKGRGAHCRWHHCSSSQAGCGHPSHGHLRLWVSHFTPLIPELYMLHFESWHSTLYFRHALAVSVTNPIEQVVFLKSEHGLGNGILSQPIEQPSMP